VWVRCQVCCRRTIRDEWDGEWDGAAARKTLSPLRSFFRELCNNKQQKIGISSKSAPHFSRCLSSVDVHARYTKFQHCVHKTVQSSRKKTSDIELIMYLRGNRKRWTQRRRMHVTEDSRDAPKARGASASKEHLLQTQCKSATKPHRHLRPAPGYCVTALESASCARRVRGPAASAKQRRRRPGPALF
jgi:hypothetical protein